MGIWLQLLRALVQSRFRLRITDAIMPGVVSIPHESGHTLSKTKTQIASEHAGVNTNILTDEVEIDPLSGNAVLNGIPVTVEKVLTS